jgi:adenylate cyclase
VALPLPDKPSIIVLPFVNLSGDPTQEYFSDGMTEEITAALSRISSLFVIARTSAFTYKGKAAKVQDISREMGVRYVLEGSARKADEQVRIIAQLVDATTGAHLWSERYDRPLKDIFALQDDIVQKIVTTLRLQLTLWEQGVLVRKRTDNPEAYDYNLRGIEYFMRLTKAANTQARQLYEKAIELDPQYAEAYARLAWTYLGEWIWLWSLDPQTLEQAVALASKAITLDGSIAYAHALLGYVCLLKKQHEQAIAEGEQALILDPNFAIGHVILAEILILAGRLEDAVQLAKKAMHLDPRNGLYSFQLGHAYQLMGRYEEALTAFRRVLTWNPNHVATHRHLAVIYSELDREEEARAEGAVVLRLAPDSSLEVIKQRLPYQDPAIAERYLDALRKAG